MGRWARKPVNHTSWVSVVTPTDRPKSVRNRCLIELFCGVVCVVSLPFWHFCWCRGFCHRTEADLFLFLLLFVEIPCKIQHTDYKLKRQLYVITCSIFNDFRTFELLFSTKYTKEIKEKQNKMKTVMVSGSHPVAMSFWQEWEMYHLKLLYWNWCSLCALWMDNW